MSNARLTSCLLEALLSVVGGRILLMAAGQGVLSTGVDRRLRLSLTGDAEESVALERARREVRQLAETGGVLRVDPLRPAGHRSRTPGGALVDWAERRSDSFVRFRRLWASRP